MSRIQAIEEHNLLRSTQGRALGRSLAIYTCSSQEAKGGLGGTNPDLWTSRPILLETRAATNGHAHDPGKHSLFISTSKAPWPRMAPTPFIALPPFAASWGGVSSIKSTRLEVCVWRGGVGLCGPVSVCKCVCVCTRTCMCVVTWMHASSRILG